MMNNDSANLVPEDKIYRSFGELLYALLCMNGSVQANEVNVVRRVLLNYPWAGEVRWSFDYERDKGMPMQAVYVHVLSVFIEHGPFEHYETLFEIGRMVLKATRAENAPSLRILDKFRDELLRHFMENQKIGYNYDESDQAEEDEEKNTAK